MNLSVIGIGHEKKEIIGYRYRLKFFISCITIRLLMISGHINSFPISILNIYTPNIDNPVFFFFFLKAFDMIPAASSNVIIGGDFNCYLDPILDTFSTKMAPTITSVQTLNDLIKTRNMVDILGLRHPTDRDYSFYSHVHKSYTRIDDFLISSDLQFNSINSTTNNILVYDHSLVSLQFKGILSKEKYSWRFNPLFLNDHSFTEHMTACIDEFLITITGGNV